MTRVTAWNRPYVRFADALKSRDPPALATLMDNNRADRNLNSMLCSFPGTPVRTMARNRKADNVYSETETACERPCHGMGIATLGFPEPRRPNVQPGHYGSISG